MDHHRGRPDVRVRVLWETGEEGELPVHHFFRASDDPGTVDAAALRIVLSRSPGSRVLDVGAGAGVLSVALTRVRRRVTALETLPEAVTILRERGVEDVRPRDVWTFAPERPYDVVAGLMNGTGLAGTLARLPAYLSCLAGLLEEGGSVLLDSWDPLEPGAPTERDDGRYVGELQMQLSYGDLRGEPFSELFVDPDRLGTAAREAGLVAEVAAREDDGRYLAVLTRPGVG